MHETIFWDENVLMLARGVFQDCRFNPRNKKTNLERQIQGLQTKFPLHTFSKDFCSGLNYNSDARKTYNLGLDYILRNHSHRYDKLKDLKLPDLDVMLVKKFVSYNGIAQTPFSVLLRTPKVIRQQAVKSLISVLKSFKTNFEKLLFLRLKYPDAYSFRKNIKFTPKFKSKKFTSDSFAFEKTTKYC